jgi:hypothetical protein
MENAQQAVQASASCIIQQTQQAVQASASCIIQQMHNSHQAEDEGVPLTQQDH